MSELIPTFGQFWLVVVIGIITYILTFITTHSRQYNLAQIEMLNHKPFTCWLCSYAWINSFISLNLAFINPMYLLWCGIVTGIGIFIIYKRNKEIEKERKK